MKIGIDFGNTVARAAYINEQGIPEVVPDFDDPTIQVTPSVLHIGSRGCLIGQGVEELLEKEPHLPVARNFKALLGTEEDCYRDEEGHTFKPVHLTALLLRKLVQDAEKAAADSVEGIVLTVPKWFGRKEKEKVTQAAEIAGISNLEFAHESIAVVHHYGLGERSPSKRQVLVYDLGSTSFSACVVTVDSEGLAIAGSASMTRGSSELDDQIVELARSNFRFAHGNDPLEDPIAEVQLRHLAAEVKAELSQKGVNSVRRSLLICGKPLEFYLSRRQLEKMAEKLLVETIETTQKALQIADLEMGDINFVLMSGGNCALGLIAGYLMKKAGFAPGQIKRQQTDLAVAFGAAHLTKTMKESPRVNQERLVKSPAASAQVLGKDLAVRSLIPGSRDEVSHVIIKKDSPLPARRELRCTTAKTDQEEIRFDWNLQGNDESQTVSLGESVFKGLPADAKGYPIDLTVTAQLDGTIEVQFTDPKTGEKDLQRLECRERRELSDKEQVRSRLRGLPINH